MVWSDFLSRQRNDDSNPHEIIPISFNTYKFLKNNYYNIGKYLIQTRSQAKSKGYTQVKEELEYEERNLTHQSTNQPSELSQKIPGKTKIETGKTNQAHTRDLTHSINNVNEEMTSNKPLIPDVPFHPDPVLQTPTQTN